MAGAGEEGQPIVFAEKLFAKRIRQIRRMSEHHTASPFSTHVVLKDA
jgi:hypothetical protein